MTYADDLKAQAISCLLPLLKIDEIVGSEVRFGEGLRRADLVISSPHRLSAFEVKGPRDNLDKLSAQSTDYAKAFLDYSVISDPSWLAAIRARVPRSTGLLTLHGAHLKPIRLPMIRKWLSRDEALEWLRTTELRSLLRSHGLKADGSFSVLAKRVKENIQARELCSYTLKAIHGRLQPRYDAFRNELGRTVTLDDVHMLTLDDRVIDRHG